MTETLTPAAAVPEHPGAAAAAPHRTWTRVRLGYVVALTVCVTAILGARVEWDHHQPPPAVISVAHPAQAVPASPAVEASWGLRFTDVIVLADNGGVELRYQVIDDSKAARIHQGNATSNQLPSLVVDGTNHTVTPSDVLMHFHHGDATAGRTYSIIYGNAGGAVRAGQYVTIVMKDGQKIRHIQVSN